MVKNIKIILILVSVISLFTGCALRQAPLMYSSKTTIGIDIGTSVAENGGNINIGFKNHDLVYIPVAVSNEDKNTSNTDQNISLTKIESIGENNNTRDTISIFATFSEDFSKDKNDSKTLGFGIEKFLSTGMAAQNLSKALLRQQCMSLAKDLNDTQKLEAFKFCIENSKK